MGFLAGEWVFAWVGMSVTLLVALLGVTGLGWWVLREDARNRKVDDPEEYAETDAKPKEALH